jgi:uncharacterized protein with von Willebrand factor type A (vWA) domain
VADLAGVAAAFGERLHNAGIPITPERSARFAEALALIEPTTVEQLYWIGRITLLSESQQLDTYDRVFSMVFRGIVESSGSNAYVEARTSTRAKPQPQGLGLDDAKARPGSSRPRAISPKQLSESSGDSEQEGAAFAAVSEQERLSSKPFPDCTPEELALIAELVERLPMVPPVRERRRTRRHPGGSRLDVRATLRRAHSTGGDPVRVVRRRRTQRPRRVVLIADVSGSMEPYARVYLHLMRGAVRALHAEAFVFATRLTRLTRALAKGQPDVAYGAVAKAAPDWSGGTRIGRALATFLDEFGRRGMARGAVVVIVSDGWELDDPTILRQAMQRLSLLAHHIIWVNPRLAHAAYQPLVGGMAAALPYVDTFVSGHSLRALDDVLQAIHTAAPRERTLLAVS